MNSQKTVIVTWSSTESNGRHRDINKKNQQGDKQGSVIMFFQSGFLSVQEEAGQTQCLAHSVHSVGLSEINDDKEVAK